MSPSVKEDKNSLYIVPPIVLLPKPLAILAAVVF
jgi:hypothetical protein